jgi:hypothetical protein
MPGLADSPRRSNQSFTSIKLTWMTCVMSQGLTLFDKCVAFVIMNAINEKTGNWKLSDETVAALMGKPGSVRSVIRAGMRLRAAGWLTWKRTADANVYSLCHRNVMEALDEIMRQRMERKERRTKREVTPVSCPKVTPASPIHTRRTYLEERKHNKRVRLKVLESESEALSRSAIGRIADAPPRQLPLVTVVGGRR